MLSLTVLTLLLLSVLVTSSPLFTPNNFFNLFKRGDDEDPFDLSATGTIVALGDSYSAGIGAGSRLGGLLSPIWDERNDWQCSRYNSSYPSLVNKHVHGDKTDKFFYRACSGDTTQDVIDSQLPDEKHRDVDVFMISAGGNDAELTNILNQCVFQWFSPTPIAMGALRELLVAGDLPNATHLGYVVTNPAKASKYTRTCEDQLNETERLINDPGLQERIGKIIDEAKSRVKKDTGVVYWTGYAKFFDENIDEDDYCAKPEHTWSLFFSRYAPSGVTFRDPVIMTKDLRQRMNKLVQWMNDKIEEVVKEKAEGDDERVVFINYDRYFGDVYGRFCTQGLNIPENDRMADLAFFPLNVWDPFGTAPMKPGGSSPGLVMNDTFEFEVDYLAEMGVEAGLDYKSNVPLNRAKTKDLETGSKGDDDDEALAKRTMLLPDGIGRVFHPSIFGHSIIANLITWNLEQRNKKRLGMDKDVEATYMDDVCPIDPPRGLECLKSEWGAQKTETTDGSTSVIAGIKEFCQNHNLDTVKSNEERIYDRWDVSGWGITKRQSYWISATTGPYNQCNNGTIMAPDCEKVLGSGILSCDVGSTATTGIVAQGDGCVQYAIDISPSVIEGDAPWHTQRVKTYPPPEDIRSDLPPASLDGQRIVCSTDTADGVSQEDADAAIEQYCGNDSPFGDPNLPLGGFELTVNKGNLAISASHSNGLEDTRGYSGPYSSEDRDYCKAFDATHKSQDDCRYAFRKILFSKMGNHAFCIMYYRCVGYMVVGGEYSSPLHIEKGMAEASQHGAFNASTSFSNSTIIGFNGTEGHTNATMGNLTMTANNYVAEFLKQLGSQ